MIEKAIDKVNQAYNIDKHVLITSQRRKVCDVRIMLWMHLHCNKHITIRALSEIFNKHPRTIMAGIATCKNRIKFYKDFKDRMNKMIDSIV